jgi:hypothetical protein
MFVESVRRRIGQRRQHAISASSKGARRRLGTVADGIVEYRLT